MLYPIPIPIPIPPSPSPIPIPCSIQAVKPLQEKVRVVINLDRKQ